MSRDIDTLAIARRYLAAIERGAIGDELAAFFTPDVVQEELPNRLMAEGVRRDLAAILAGAERGRELMAAQRFEVLSEMASGDRVALEVHWTGTLAVSLGSLAAGSMMTADIAVFLEFRAGRIAAQRNYDCYRPW